MPGEWAREYVGIEFAEHGDGRDGANCWGLVRLVQREQCDRTIPVYGLRTVDPTDSAAVAREVAQAIGEWMEVAPGREEEFDAVLMRIAGEPCHIGIVVRAGTMLHIRRGANAIIERYESIKWRSRIIGFYRWAR